MYNTIGLQLLLALLNSSDNRPCPALQPDICISLNFPTRQESLLQKYYLLTSLPYKDMPSQKPPEYSPTSLHLGKSCPSSHIGCRFSCRMIQT